MGTKSPTSVKSREMIGVDQFSQRREVFDQPDVVYVPIPSPTTLTPVYTEVQPIITSNHGKTTSNFKRNNPGYSSMRESKTDERNYDFRPRKYSDNFTSELNKSDDVDYRHSTSERTRRLSKLRRDFLASNLHDPSDQSFVRNGTRASMPVKPTSPLNYKIESPNLYKFPFAEPYTSPTPVRRVVVDLGSNGTVDGKENQDPAVRTKYESLPNNYSPTTIDRQKFFEELIKRYSPPRKPVDWTLPPTRPRVVSSVPKSNSSVSDVVDKIEKPKSTENYENDDEVFQKQEDKPHVEILQNGPELVLDTINKDKVKNEKDSKQSLTELAEKNDHLSELTSVQRQLSKDSHKKLHIENDLTIPALIEKISTEGDNLENNRKSTKKVKRKRSFLDKLLGRNKNNTVK
ncbi:uncharacterized protein LOC131852146 [Achroia grisella]|uniref:uncharacterized protein LOC131852146 n=1 Tax=Achroia grisella TaxID=688607 RepID=UPI0027D2CD6E|nr:uncharacterized protein LOC131852146 [Achroia grisella]